MKRNFSYVAAVIALCVLGSCKGDNPAANDGDSTLVPDANGMVTLRMSTTGNAWSDESQSATRAAGTPIRATEDLGDGYVLNLEMREGAPATRGAVTRATLGSGVSVLLIAFDKSDAEGSTPLGYERLSIGSDGGFDAMLPVDKNLKLVFYSLNKTTPKMDPSLYIAGAADADKVVDGQFYWLSTSGTYTPPTTPPAIPMEENTVNGDVDSKIPADALYAQVTAETTTSSSSTLSSPVSFTHLLAQVTLNMTMGGKGGSITTLDATFYPRYSDPTLTMATMGKDNAKATDVWKGTTPFSGGKFFTAANSVSPSTPTYFRFAPVNDGTAASKAYLFLNQLVFKETGYNEKEVKAKSIPLIQPKQKSTDPSVQKVFQPGHEYTITISIANKDDGTWIDDSRVQPGDWAASNIYWDGKKLTFDQYGGSDPAGATTDRPVDPNSPYYAGVYFKWGSLIGVSPIDHKNADGTTWMTIFMPEDTTALVNGTSTIGIYTAANHISSADYNDAIKGSLLGLGRTATNDSRDATEGYDIDDNLYTHYDKYWHTGNVGDICAFITGGKWRIPNNSDLLNSGLGGGSDNNTPWRESSLLAGHTEHGYTSDINAYTWITNTQPDDGIGWWYTGTPSTLTLPTFLDEGGHDTALKDGLQYHVRFKRSDNTTYFTTSLPMAGGRFYQNGANYTWGYGSYWLSTVSSFTATEPEYDGWMTSSSEPAAYYMLFRNVFDTQTQDESIAPVWSDFYREWGFSVRCIRNNN
ncbi:MAG: hypothetical protein LBN24_01435 [Mediterranea sp.]|jgi:hypothetical protein|nr:hypothetical protein [Mediterranea sp.]